MAKSSKKSKEATAQEGASTTPRMESSNGFVTAGSAKPADAKKAAAKSTGRAKSVGRNRSATPRKASAGRKTGAKTLQQPPATGDVAITDEAIRIRAYLISQWRMQNGVPGDSAHDWLEARRQLQEESDRRG
jgi:hypothetical protein